MTSPAEKIGTEAPESRVAGNGGVQPPSATTKARRSQAVAVHRNGFGLLGAAFLCTAVWTTLPLIASQPQPSEEIETAEFTLSIEPNVRHAEYIAASGNSGSGIATKPNHQMIRQVSSQFESASVTSGHSFGAPPTASQRSSGVSSARWPSDFEAANLTAVNGRRPRPISVLPNQHGSNQLAGLTRDAGLDDSISIMPRGKDGPSDVASPLITNHGARSVEANRREAASVQQTTASHAISVLPGERDMGSRLQSGHSHEVRPVSVLPSSAAETDARQQIAEADADLRFSQLPGEADSAPPRRSPATAGHSFLTPDRSSETQAAAATDSRPVHVPPSSQTHTIGQTSTSNVAKNEDPMPYSVLPQRYGTTDAPRASRPTMTAGHAGLQIPNADATPATTLAAPSTNSTFPSQPFASNQSGFATRDSSHMGADRRTLLWWEERIGQPILTGRHPLPMSLQQALGLALTEAPELKVLNSDWFIQQAEVDRLDAAFDWTTFAETIWNRDSNPVGSTLDGAAQQLRSRTLSSRSGVKRLSRDGSEFELAQNFGTKSSNSQFISPNYQGTSRITFDYQRPLLQGAGEHYNTSAVRLAEIGKDTAYDRLQVGIQDHLLEVASSYWALVLRRGQYLQAVTSLQRATQIADEMAGRIEVDVTPAMMDRARSEVATRKASSIEARHDIVRAQDALLRLIYGSRFADFVNQEVLPETLPMRQCQPMQPEQQIEKALHERSEIHEAIREIKAASVRFDVAANEILPVLDMVLTGYVAGLRGNSNIGQAWLDQFQRAEPGVGIGFNFEIPYRNRAAQAKAEQGHVAIRRMQAQLEATIGMVTEDVRNQVIQRNKYGAVLAQQREALDRANKILKYTETRRAVLADGVAVADLYLENLLQMQARLQSAEFGYLESQVRYSLADNALLRATSQIDTIAKPGSPGGRLAW